MMPPLHNQPSPAPSLDSADENRVIPTWREGGGKDLEGGKGDCIHNVGIDVGFSLFHSYSFLLSNSGVVVSSTCVL